MTIPDFRKKLDSKEISSVELTKQYLETTKKLNPDINAFITISEETALSHAKKADDMIAKGEAKELTGIPYAIKDVICTQEIRTTGAAKILDNYIPPYDATVIARIQDQGGVIIGKQNCDAFGHGGSNENTHYGSVKNPWDKTKIPGGSSGGSAAAIAADMCVYSIGGDTGGSVRQPAGMCGVTGLRASYGRNSRYGLMPMASSLDTIGPLAQTAEEVAMIMDVIAGQDLLDATTVPEPVPNYSWEIKKPLEQCTIGIPKEYFEEDGIESDVLEAVDKGIEQLKLMGCKVRNVSLPHTKYAIATYYIIISSEDSSNLARLEGIRYGVRGEGESLFDVYKDARAKGFPDEVKRRIMIGTYALSSGYYDAFYKKAQKVRTLIKQDFNDVFEDDVDLLIMPTAPTTAFGLGEKIDDPLQMYLADTYCVSAGLAGVPGISVPCGFDSKKLPIGMQIIGQRMQESKVMQLAHNYQQHTDWHKQKPKL